jgi:hypothetical protein
VSGSPGRLSWSRLLSVFGGPEKIIEVPTLSTRVKDFSWLFTTFGEIDRFAKKEPGGTVVLDFSQCTSLQQNAVALLGGTARNAESHGAKVVFKWDTLQPRVRLNLEKNGFIAAFGGGLEWDQGNTIPYREHRLIEQRSVVDYLRSRWLARGWVQMTDAVQDAVIGNMWELYANAFEHADSPIGVFSCGQYFPKEKAVKFTVADFGVGIPQNVRRHFGRYIRADRAIDWAFREGTSTKSARIPRGLGLATVLSLIKANSGKLELFSNEGQMTIRGDRKRLKSYDHYFRGTIMTIEFQCDSLLYCFGSEFSPGRRE